MLYNTIKMTIAYFIPDACGREKENIRLKIPLAMIKKKRIDFKSCPLSNLIHFFFSKKGKSKSLDPQKDSPAW